MFGNPFCADFEVSFGESEALIVFDAQFLVDREGGGGIGVIFGFADSGESWFQAFGSSVEKIG